MTNNEKVIVEANIKNFHLSKNNIEMVTLEDVYINGSNFRDHSFVKKTKQFNDVATHDRVSFTALVKLYPDPNTNKVNKVGLRHIRNIRKV